MIPGIRNASFKMAFQPSSTKKINTEFALVMNVLKLKSGGLP